ncbi:MAG: sigma-70 family RNA polymerase sigma factor [Nannocystaceae bacterium]
MSKDSDDLTLVEACRAGDRRAFRILMERHQRRIYTVAYGYVRTKEDALDVVQESFLKVHRYLDNFRGGSSFYTWLYRVVSNVCIDHLRRNKRRRAVEYQDEIRHDSDTALDEEADRRIVNAGDPSALLERKEILAAVQDSLRYLSDTHREIIVMRELQGMTYEEMAQAMKCSKGTIMSRLFHARKNLQKRLLERFDEKAPSVGAAEKRGESVRAPKVVLP